MATTEQIAANRKNARRSMGPKAASGRSRSARNGLFTGLLARDIITSLENHTDLDALLEALHADLQPVDTHQHILVTRYARQLWLAQRIARIECAAAQSQLDAATLERQMARSLRTLHRAQAQQKKSECEPNL